ncbi:hypothetical protein BKH46_07695 [Helicobacter sp. 12S02634-8]|uniref:hypothetical protein n=1 Tax=Helicobacter sp. 12S02634-8 TaxID=1476199 RepID=UPI000BA64929|nr:hypothetical protein [Helicobacter sp. 12S02634-8]PAF46344.1 hypothetical protein BKH46_07695 [Helicobacter sp. 12S02634-8]
MIEVKISPLPTPPSTQDALNFAQRADAFMEALPKFQEELNVFAQEGNALKDVLHQTTQSLIIDLNDIKNASKEELDLKTQSAKTQIDSKLKDTIESIEQKVGTIRLDELLNAYDTAKSGSIAAIKSQQEQAQESLEALKQESLESFQTSKQTIIESILAQQKNPKDLEWKLLTQIELWLDHHIKDYKKEMEEKERIGKIDCFFRSNLPSTHTKLNQTLKACDYPLLWFYSIGLKGNAGGVDFSFPKESLQTQAGSSLGIQEDMKLCLEGVYAGSKNNPQPQAQIQAFVENLKAHKIQNKG